MKARRTCLIIAMAALMVFALALLGSCSQKNDEEVISESLAEELDEIKNCDGEVFDKISSYIGIDTLGAFGVDPTEFAKAYFKDFDYQIDDITVDGDEAQAQVTFVCKSLSDYEQALDDAILNGSEDNPDQSTSDEDIDARIGEVIMTTLEGVPVAQSEPVTITYVKDDNVWTPSDSSTSDIVAAITSL